MLVGRTTDRIRWFRERELQPDERKLVDDVEKHGCHVLSVREEGGFPGWCYTIGLADVLGCPELIVIGLKLDVAHWLLNECARRLQQGLRLEESQRVDGLLSNVECEFRAIEKRWIRQTMGYAVWYNGGDGFGVLQCVYPDLGKHFPWDEGFDDSWRKRQPLLFQHSLNPNVEIDFWAANDPTSSLHRWKFNDPPHTGVFTTKRVMSGEDPITRVFHDIEDGAWQFHGPEESDPKDLAYVCLHHVIDNDATISELHDLPAGWCAWRENVSSPWTRELAPPDEDEPDSQ
ncbi:MAG TPA: DUF4262 domain-containing protein [Terriglobales bacterium]